MSFRDRTVMMSRMKNEQRWVKRCLESVWPLARTVVIWDDGSTDATELLAIESMAGVPLSGVEGTLQDILHLLGGVDSEITPFGLIARASGPEGVRELHYIHSPFMGRARMDALTHIWNVNEIRDKNMLWAYLKSNISFDYVIALDGDEAFSKAAVRTFQSAINAMNAGIDCLHVPVLYFWDNEERIRVDGVYGRAGDGFARLRFPRIFTTQRVDQQHLFDMCFAWFGTRGGFHCGSVPQQGFRVNGDQERKDGLFKAPIVHFGYIDDELRHRKFEFYTTIDPNNDTEGGYLHIIGERNCHQPGDVQFESWRDE